ADRGCCLLWRVAGMAGYRHHPRLRLEDDVDAGPVGIRAVGAEGRDHRVHHRRVHLPHALLAVPHPLHRSPAQVVEHDVGSAHQPVHPAAGIEVLRIDRHRTLAAVYRQEEGRLTSKVGAESPSEVPGGSLDFDHVGSHVCQQHPRIGAGDQIGELDHPDAGEWSRAHTLSTTAAIPWPTPMHMVASPYLPARRRNSWTSVVRIRAPEAPSGCPSAIAPPLTLTRSGSRPRSL